MQLRSAVQRLERTSVIEDDLHGGRVRRHPSTRAGEGAAGELSNRRTQREELPCGRTIATALVVGYVTRRLHANMQQQQQQQQSAAGERDAARCDWSERNLSQPKRAKLLWQGAKASAVDAASAFGTNRWDAAQFSSAAERERFLRLMGAGKGASSGPAGGGGAGGEGVALSAPAQQQVMAQMEHQHARGRQQQGSSRGLGS